MISAKWEVNLVRTWSLLATERPHGRHFESLTHSYEHMDPAAKSLLVGCHHCFRLLRGGERWYLNWLKRPGQMLFLKHLWGSWQRTELQITSRISSSRSVPLTRSTWIYPSYSIITACQIARCSWRGVLYLKMAEQAHWDYVIIHGWREKVLYSMGCPAELIRQTIGYYKKPALAMRTWRLAVE